MDASNMLKPALARGELHVIGATTLDEYRKNVEKDPALERRFQPVFVREPTVDETIEILQRPAATATRRSTASGSPNEAIVAAAELSDRYIRDRFLPDKAIDLIDQASARVRLRTKTKDDETQSLEDDLRRLARERDQATVGRGLRPRPRRRRSRSTRARSELEDRKKGRQRPSEVTAEDIAEVVSRATGIPVSQLTTRGARAAAPARAAAARTDRRPGRGGRGGRGGGPPLTRRARRPEPAGRELPLRRADRRRQDRARRSPGRSPLRPARAHGALRHERVSHDRRRAERFESAGRIAPRGAS